MDQTHTFLQKRDGEPIRPALRDTREYLSFLPYRDLLEYKGIKYGTNKIALGQLSSDFIENLFSRIKETHGNPTPAQIKIQLSPESGITTNFHLFHQVVSSSLLAPLTVTLLITT